MTEHNYNKAFAISFMQLSLLSIFLFLSLCCKSQNDTSLNGDLSKTTGSTYESERKGKRKPIEAIFTIKNWGRVYDPISINLLNLSNIDRITTEKTRRCFKKDGNISIYLKEGVQLISLKELFDRYSVSKKYRKGVPIQLNNQFTMRPRKLLFDPSQNFKIDINEKPSDTSVNRKQYISITVIK